MNEWITEKLKSLKEDLSKKQELFKVNIMNINSPTYEDNTINDLLVMKKLKTEIISATIAKSKKLGNYNMMMGENPIYIVKGEKDEEN